MNLLRSPVRWLAPMARRRSVPSEPPTKDLSLPSSATKWPRPSISETADDCWRARLFGMPTGGVELAALRLDDELAGTRCGKGFAPLLLSAGR